MKPKIQKLASRLTLQASLLLLALGPALFAPGQQGTIQLPATGQVTSYYPGDDGDLQMGVPFPANRFTDNGDGSIADIFTGLMWVKDANLIASRNPSYDQDRIPGDGDLDWTRALDYIQLLNDENYLGYDDWRLPTVIELLSLIDYSQAHTGLSAGHPFLNVMGGYWSSTTWERFRGMGIPVFLKEYRVHANTNLLPGDMEGLNKDLDIYSPAYYKLYVMPVRDGENAGAIGLPRSGQKISYYSGDDGEVQPGHSLAHSKAGGQPEPDRHRPAYRADVDTGCQRDA